MFKLFWLELPSFHFMLFDRYWSHNTNFTFHVFEDIDSIIKISIISISCFLKILIPYSIFSRIYKEDLQTVSARVFSNIFKVLDVQDFVISKNVFFEKDSTFLELFEVIWVSPKTKLVLGVMSPSENPNILQMMLFWLPKWNQKVTSPKRSRIILRSFKATLFLTFTIKMSPRPPQTPKPDFPRIFYRESMDILWYSGRKRLT